MSQSLRGTSATGSLFSVLSRAQRDGWDCGLLTLRGGDGAGSRLARSIAGRGIEDLGVVFLDRETPVERDPQDRDASAFGLYAFGFAKQMRRRHFRDAAARADAILVDTSLPEAALAAVIKTATVPVLAVESEVGDPARLRNFIDRLAAVVVHEESLRSMLGLTRTASLGTIAGAVAKARVTSGVIMGVGSAVNFRFRNGTATLLKSARRDALVAAAVLELAAFRSAA